MLGASRVARLFSSSALGLVKHYEKLSLRQTTTQHCSFFTSHLLTKREELHSDCSPPIAVHEATKDGLGGAHAPTNHAQSASAFASGTAFLKGDTLGDDEEKWNPEQQQIQLEYDPIERLNLKRGRTGVFDMAELIELLEEKGAYDVCAIAVPREMKYVDYLLLVTAKSPKHLQALATFIRRAFKRKHLKPTDILPAIEGGKDARDWVALDLGNIALHIFIEDKRQEVDLESLWLLGPEYDDITNEKDSQIVNMLDSFASTHAEAQK